MAAMWLFPVVIVRQYELSTGVRDGSQGGRMTWSLRVSNPAFAGPTASGLSPDHLEELRPYVVNLTHGGFSSDGIMQTTQDDVDAIFDVHLPAFIDRAERTGAGPV